MSEIMGGLGNLTTLKGRLYHDDTKLQQFVLILRVCERSQLTNSTSEPHIELWFNSNPG